MRDKPDERYAPWWLPLVVFFAALALNVLVLLAAAIEVERLDRTIKALEGRVRVLEEQRR